jgi:hypothetical protein
MRPHPYLRAYMAGIVVPTVVLLGLVAVFATFRFYVFPLDARDAPAPLLGEALALERLGRAIIFPMAVVPNLWGLWNMLHLGLKGRASLPLGVHGALLPLLLVPLGIALAHAVGFFNLEARYVVPFAATAMAVYYLVWKHVVGFLNQEMGIA